MSNPITASFPYAAPGDVDFTIASENAFTTLSSSMSNNQTTMDVASVSGFVLPTLLAVENELILATGTSSNTFTGLIRGFAGTSAVTHTSGVDVNQYITAYHHNKVVAELSAVSKWVHDAEFSGLQRYENFVTWSEAFEMGTWNKLGGATVTISGNAPDGNATARIIQDGTSSGSHGVSGSLDGTPANGIGYVWSIYAKAEGGSQWISVGEDTAIDTTKTAWFDLVNGVVGTVGNAAKAMMVPMGDGWFRCMVLVAAVSGSHFKMEVMIAPSDGALTYTASGLQISVWGAQVCRFAADVPLHYVRTQSYGVSTVASSGIEVDDGGLAAGIAKQRRRGTTTEHQSFTGLPGELTVDTTKWTVSVHNGADAGGVPLAKEIHGHSDASESTSGFLSASDKTKIDALPSNIANQVISSNSVVKTQRNTVDFGTAFRVSDDAGGNRTLVEVADTGVQVGTFTKITVNSRGQATNGDTLVAGDIPTLPSSKISGLAGVIQAMPLSAFALPTADIALNSHKLTGLGAPTLSDDAATKQYVDSLATGLNFKTACRVATVANITLSGPGTLIDGVSLVNGDRILVKDQTLAQNNGIYVFNGPAAALTRSLDANQTGEINPGMFVWIDEGTSNGGTAFVLATNGAISVGATPLSFVVFAVTTSTNFVDDEVPTGAIDSANQNFTLAHTPRPVASLQLFLDGVLQMRGTAYTLSGAAVSFVAAPTSGAGLVAFYRY